MIKKKEWAGLMVMTISLAGNICLNAQQSESRCLSIDELFHLVETNSKTLRVQKSGTEIAAEAVKTAQAQRLPDISTQLSASYLGNGFTTNRDFGDFTKAPIPHFGNNFALEASQVVYSGGAISNNIALAKLAYQQSAASTAQNSLQVKFIALGQYLDLYKLYNQVKVYEQNIGLTRRLIENTEARHQQGTALQNDITRYELQLEYLKLGLTKLKDEISIQNHQLCTTIGVPLSTSIVPDTTIISRQYATDEEQSWQTIASTASPTLKQASIGVDMAHAQEKIVRSELLPKVAVVAANHFDGPITIEVPPINRNFNYWYVGLGIKYNLSSLFKNDKKLKEAKLAVRQSDENRLAVEEQLENAVQSAYTYYKQSFVEWQTQQKSVELASQNYNVVNDRYLNQLALITDMIDASNMKLSAELQEVNARIGIVYAYYKMKYTSGNL
jgi:outer membrane protein